MFDRLANAMGEPVGLQKEYENTLVLATEVNPVTPLTIPVGTAELKLLMVTASGKTFRKKASVTVSAARSLIPVSGNAPSQKSVSDYVTVTKVG